jgi:hypothetical protein
MNFCEAEALLLLFSPKEYFLPSFLSSIKFFLKVFVYSKRNVLTMSFAPRDSHEAQVQFALERGMSALVGVMETQRLPYPF